MILVVVYVGAVAVLFLFVVMMLDVDFAELKQGFLQYLPIGGTLGLVVLIEVVLVVGAWTIGPVSIANVATPMPPGMTNTMALGRVLYTQYLYLFQAAGLHSVDRDDRRDRLDLAPQGRGEAPEHRGAERAHARRGGRNPQGRLEAGNLNWASSARAQRRRKEKPC